MWRWAAEWGQEPARNGPRWKNKPFAGLPHCRIIGIAAPMSFRDTLMASAKRLWTPAYFAYAINGAVAASSFLSTLILARIAGPAVIGQYALAIATGNLMVVLAVQGLDRLLIREVAGDLRVQESGKARRALKLIAMRVALAGAVIGGGWTLLLLLTPINLRMDGDKTAMLLIGVFVLVTAVFRIVVAAIRATDSPIVGQLTEAAPTLLLPPALGLLWLFHEAPTPGLAVAFVLGLNLLTLLVAFFLLRRTVRTWDQPMNVDPRLLQLGLPFMGIMLLQLFVDWLVLAQLSGAASPADAGAFRVSYQIITIFLTLIATTEIYVAPRFAGDFRVGRYDLAWNRYRKGRLLIGALTFPVLLLCTLAPHWLLSTAFGHDFAVASTALMIMALGQLVNVGKGPVGSMLSMAGHDRMQLGLTIAGTIAGVIACFILIPRYGLIGGALSQVVPQLIRGIGSYIAAHRMIPRAATTD